MLFLATYPTNKTNREGMFQRIGNIDNIFNDRPRVYVGISIFGNLNLRKEKVDSNLLVYRINLFLHFFTLISLLKNNSNIYVHSLYNCIPLLFISSSNRTIVLDVHGVVPEELKFNGQLLKSSIYKVLEKLVFNKFSGFVFVTNSMKNYYLSKYPFIQSKETIVYPILSIQVFSNTLSNRAEFLHENGILESDVVFIYSGNLQKWQNFNLVIDLINLAENKDYKFIILTGEIDKVKKMVSKFVKNTDHIIIKSVDASELHKYYSISHYGFILRDDHVLNRVASPTKLVEYMYYGLIPIVKCESIGDFHEMGYEFLSFNDFNDNLQQRHSIINKTIISGLLENNLGYKIHDLFFNRF